jgi:hypothetical protein
MCRRLNIGLLISILNVVLCSLVYCNDEDQRKLTEQKLTDYVVNSALPKTGITRGFSESTMPALLDFIGRSEECIAKLELSKLESEELRASVGHAFSEEEADAFLSRLGNKTQSRLESIATSIDGVGRIPERLKFNQLTLSVVSIQKLQSLRKKFILEKFGPLASSAFALASSEPDRIAVAVAEVKHKIDFGIQLSSILTPIELRDVVEFVSLSDAEANVRNIFITTRYDMMNGLKEIVSR